MIYVIYHRPPSDHQNAMLIFHNSDPPSILWTDCEILLTEMWRVHAKSKEFCKFIFFNNHLYCFNSALCLVRT